MRPTLPIDCGDIGGQLPMQKQNLSSHVPKEMIDHLFFVDNSGLVLTIGQTDPSVITISRVLQSTPAALAGLHIGDAIQSINGKAVSAADFIIHLNDIPAKKLGFWIGSRLDADSREYRSRSEAGRRAVLQRY